MEDCTYYGHKYYDLTVRNPKTGRINIFKFENEKDIQTIDGKKFVKGFSGEDFLWEVEDMEDVTHMMILSRKYFDHFGTTCE